MARLADLAQRRMLDELNQAQMYSMRNPDNQLASLIDRGGNFMRNDQTGEVTNFGPSMPEPVRPTGSPVDVFGQGRGYLDPFTGIIRGTNRGGNQFVVQPEGTNDAVIKARILEEDRALKMAEAQARMDALKQKQSAPVAKPLPVSALKLQQEELDAIGSASSLNKDLGAFTQMVESGKLPLGPVTNLGYKVRNLAGASTEESRNYASFQANLERLRNESLRLNKGVQTEGDAIRAWNEILANINDPQLVAQRLKEVQNVNERAIQLRKMNVDAIRSNFGQDPMDVSGRVDVPSAYDSGGTETPRVGAVVDGYVFTGGNPADPASWKEQ